MPGKSIETLHLHKTFSRCLIVACFYCRNLEGELSDLAEDLDSTDEELDNYEDIENTDNDDR